jgi:hypothetical protein
LKRLLIETPAHVAPESLLTITEIRRLLNFPAVLGSVMPRLLVFPTVYKSLLIKTLWFFLLRPLGPMIAYVWAARTLLICQIRRK